MDKKDKILVTGAAGMIGASLVTKLKAMGYIKLLAPRQTELDFRDTRAVTAYFGKHKPRYVFHLAARVGGVSANNIYPAQFIYDNTVMQSNIIEACHRIEVIKLLLPGAPSIYPVHASQPVRESELLGGHVEPDNLAYAVAKMNGLVMAQSFAREYGLRVALPVPAHTYGIGDNFDPEAAHVIPALMRRCHAARLYNAKEVVVWGTGRALREFIYVDDVADAFVFLMLHYNSYEIINVGTMQEMAIKDLAFTIARITGYEGHIVFDETKPDGAPRKMLDSGRMLALGWKPQVSLEEGLERMYKKHFVDKEAA